MEQFNGRPGPKRYILQKQGSKRSDNVKLQISFRNTHDEEKWLDAFSQAEIEMSIDDQPQPPSRENSSVWHRSEQQPDDSASQADSIEDVEPGAKGKVDGDPRHDFSKDPVMDEIMNRLKTYAKILSESLHDITPKYISYFLVCKTLKYTKRKLLADVQKEDPTSLMRVSEEQLSKRDEFFRIYNATETALKMMGDASGGGRQANKSDKYKLQNEEKPEYEQEY